MRQVVPEARGACFAPSRAYLQQSHDKGMANDFELNGHPLIAFVPTRDPDRARTFYRDLLGLHLASEQLSFSAEDHAPPASAGPVIRATSPTECSFFWARLFTSVAIQRAQKAEHEMGSYSSEFTRARARLRHSLRQRCRR